MTLVDEPLRFQIDRFDPGAVLAIMPPAPVLTRNKPRRGDSEGWPDEGTDAWIAMRCGVSTRTVIRWRQGDRLKPATADRVAISLGKHPTEIWGDDWWQA